MPVVSGTPRLSQVSFLGSSIGIVTSAYSLLKTKIGRLAAAVGVVEGVDDRRSGVDRLIYRGRTIWSRGTPSVITLPMSMVALMAEQDVPVEGPMVVICSPTFKMVFLGGVPVTGATAVTKTEDS